MLKRFSFFFFLFLIFLFYTWALDLPVSRISDDSQLRQRLEMSWFRETPSSVVSRRPVIEQLPSGERVEIRAVEGRQEIIVMISRELIRGSVGTDTASAYPRRPTGQFPGWAQGSWMLTRNKADGTGTRIRIFLRSDQHTYIDLFPDNGDIRSDKSSMDVVVYGGFLARGLPIAVSFERLYTMRLNDILRLAGDKFPAKFFNPDPAMYRDSRRFVQEVRARIRDVRYENNDGAIDENGNYIFIETLSPQLNNPGHLNCSGFVKWLIDGSLRPVTNKRLSVEMLKQPFGNRGSAFTERWENFLEVDGRFIQRDIPLSMRRDPYFGLDWIRNLAREANGVLRSQAHRSLEEFEVRSDNFSQIQVNENRTGTPSFVIHNYPGFLPEAGYSFEGLHPLLYTLAIENPFSFYLAAISTEIGATVTQDNLRGAPRLRQYYHLVALVPYFDETGVFRIVVFESATESPFAGFLRRYPGHFINLVEIPVPNRFDP